MMMAGRIKAYFSQQRMSIAVTGAAGRLAYSLLFRIASGHLFGPDQPISLTLIDLPDAQRALSGVAMQLCDCSFPLLKEVNYTSNAVKGFHDVQFAILIGALPRIRGMTPASLALANASIFQAYGSALNRNVNKEVKVLVVGSPANTNCLVAAHNAPSLPKSNFMSLCHLHYNRTLFEVAKTMKVGVDEISKVSIWGNQYNNMSPDLGWAEVKDRKVLASMSKEQYEGRFIPQVQQRGAQILEARKQTYSGSAANAVITQLRDWHYGAKWTSFGVWSNGNPYGIPDNLYFSMPVKAEQGKWAFLQNLYLNQQQHISIKANVDELLLERETVKQFLTH